MLLATLALAVFGHDHYVAMDGAWCWFADPRAIWVGDKILAGSVTQSGDVVANLYSPKDKSRQTITLSKGFERDDHDNPSFLKLKDGRVAAFFSKHTGPDLWMTETLNASDLTQWGAPRKINPNDPSYPTPKGSLNAYTYPNPVSLSREKDRVYLFWRGMNWKPTFSASNDQGKTWSNGRIVVSPKSNDPNNRPYLKASSDGKSKIHLAFTDGHPRNEPTNSIYYACYEGGSFTRANGSRIAKLDQLPLRPEETDVVYDGRSEGIRAWIWDVAQDLSGRPVIVYSRLAREDAHSYHYASWNGQRWVNRPMVAAGKWFPQTPAGTTEREPHYSGGITLDHSDPRFAYLSRPINGRFEIERWFTGDAGNSWSRVAITGESKHDSVRPFVIQGERPSPNGPTALWMNMNKYVHYTDFAGTIQAANEDRGPFPADQPRRAADAVWSWIRSNPSAYDKTEWMLAPLYSGVLAYAEWSGDSDPENWLRKIGGEIGWKMGPLPSMADDFAVGQSFLKLYMKDRDPVQLAPVKAWGDRFIAMPHDRSLEWKNGVHLEELAWCDSLYMGPPTLALLSQATGDPRYAREMVRLWWKTSDYLFDPIEHLYFRDSRYFTPREANGKKVFWSRGNGWVLAGLANILNTLPKDFDERKRLELQFTQMANKIAKLQTSDGTWHASLLDPASFPSKETSGTGFFTYALAWGVNAGLLERTTFEPTIRRAFAALCEAIDANGRVGWIQPIGQDPKLVKNSDTDTYGVGAFLLAADQVRRLGGK
ncbi:MAG: glycoside hydrolase family 88 protein [Fimbriimonadaceae bacterium]